LPADHRSLACGVPPSAARTIYVLGISGGVAVTPADERAILFGRNRPEVHVCVGEDDPKVSRRHGLVGFRKNRWWVSNTGIRPLRVAGARYLFPGEDPLPLPQGYTPLFVGGSRRREHLIELYVTGVEGVRPMARHHDPTEPPRSWRLARDERLALIVLGQRYLWHDFHPQPLNWQQTAEQLAELEPGETWTPERVERLVLGVRGRLSQSGVPGLTRDEVGEPVESTLNRNLLTTLMLSATLVPRDLALLDEICSGRDL
jgi:hypothetical protein